jgi:hypothetical protein
MCNSVAHHRIPEFYVTAFLVLIGAKNLLVDCTRSLVGSVQPFAAAACTPPTTTWGTSLTALYY